MYRIVCKNTLLQKTNSHELQRTTTIKFAVKSPVCLLCVDFTLTLSEKCGIGIAIDTDGKNLHNPRTTGKSEKNGKIRKIVKLCWSIVSNVPIVPVEVVVLQ